MPKPISVKWDGEVFKPNNWRDANCADLESDIVYIIEPQKFRSWKSHRHQFAWIKTAYETLPDHMSDQFVNSEHLRKFALIKTGYCTQKQFVCMSMSEAQRTASALKAISSEYALVSVTRVVVTVFEAESQREKTMGGERFAKSKNDILNYIAGLLGVAPGELDKQEG